MEAFGDDIDQIGAIVVVNLDRQPTRWRRVSRELRRFRTSQGVPLTSITRRLTAIDARDGRAVAATADVDPIYRLGDQLYVQPDARLSECFTVDEPVRMTRQEVAVARSHIEVWKSVAAGTAEYVMVLEDDVWFTPGAPAAIDRGWHSAIERCATKGGPRFLYVSYNDAGGTADREDPCDNLFRLVRGLWFLSGYVLSKEGARRLLGAMPVVGPVDLWMNYRFADLEALALASPAIEQRTDVTSDNAYSVLPYLARAGIVDAAHGAKPPDVHRSDPVLAWAGRREQESLGMALSMLGLRVRVFDGDEDPMDERELRQVLGTYDALVDAPLAPAALFAIAMEERCSVFLENGVPPPPGLERVHLSPFRYAILPSDNSCGGSWEVLCDVLGLVQPSEAFPSGTPRSFRSFRDDRPQDRLRSTGRVRRDRCSIDDSPWVLPPASGWQPTYEPSRSQAAAGFPLAEASMTTASASFPGMVETFPGNLASFEMENLRHSNEGAQLVIAATEGGLRPYRSGAFASTRSFRHGLFEA